LPDWVPDAVRLYLSYTEDGVSLRTLARQQGCHASTVLRQVRRFENRRDDPLVDDALARLGRASETSTAPTDIKDQIAMNEPLRAQFPATDDTTISTEARRVLRRLTETGAVLVIATELEKAVVLKEDDTGSPQRLAVLDRIVAEAFALKDWIACARPGRVARYTITTAGRSALRRMLAEGVEESDPGAFGDQHRIWDTRTCDDDDGVPRKLRYNAAESPVSALARRRDRSGTPFLAVDLVVAADRLREDFELAQMGPRLGQNWDRFLTAGGGGGITPGSGPAMGPRAARERVAAALRDLGPGLGDMTLRCCCFLEGLETAEKRLGWSARSGKIVLRIALQRLKRHYDDLGCGHQMIG
jgi:transposase-like protein